MEFTLKQQVRAALKRLGGDWDDEGTIRSCQQEAVEICGGSNMPLSTRNLRDVISEVCRCDENGG